MDGNQFEIPVAAILVAGANAGPKGDTKQGSKAASASVYDMRYAIKQLRESGFTHGTVPIPE